MLPALLVSAVPVMLLFLPRQAAAQNRILQRFPTQPFVNPRHEQIKQQADEAYRRGNYEQTVKLTTSVINENPRDHVAYYLRGSARVEIALRNRDAKEMRAGIADAREAIRLDGNRSPMYYLPYLYGMTNLAALENRPKHAEVAVQFAGQLLQVTTLSADMRANIHYQRGNAYLALGKFDQAVADFLAAIRNHPTHLGAHLAAADTYARAGQFDKAEQQYNTVVKTFPDNPLVYNNRGMFLQQRGKYKEAIADFSRALELNPKYFYANTNRGFCLLSLDQPEAAEVEFTKSLSLNPQQPAVHSLRASARIAQGKLDAALEDNRAALKLSPQNPSAHADLGFTLFFAGQYAEAAQSFRNALQLDKQQEHLAPWHYLALELSGKKAEAQATYKVLLSKPAEKRNWVESVLAFVAGQLPAEELLKAADPKNADARKAQLCEAHYFIGLKQRLSGKEKEAATHFRQAVALNQRQLAAHQGARLELGRLTAR